MAAKTTSHNLAAALDYLEQIIVGRISVEQGQRDEVDIPAPAYQRDEGPFSRFLEKYQPDFYAYVTLLLALAPNLYADFFDRILKQHFPKGADLPAFGGVRGKSHRGILPTGETAQFILAGNDLDRRLAVQALFRPDHWFATESILKLEEVPEAEPKMSGRQL